METKKKYTNGPLATAQTTSSDVLWAFPIARPSLVIVSSKSLWRGNQANPVARPSTCRVVHRLEGGDGASGGVIDT